jgi:3-oxoacyl-(acyl-carrier-protein) synthase
MKQKVAITGIGMVSPLGENTEASWSRLLAGESGVGEIKNFDASGFPTHIAAEVKGFDALTRVPSKIRKYTVPFTDFAFGAASEAFSDAGIMPTASTTDRWGCVVGAGMMTAEFSYWEKFQSMFAVDGKIDWESFNNDFDSFCQLPDFGKTIANCGLSLLLQHYQIKGYSTSVHTACASGGQALGLAMKAIKRGHADYVLAGGFDSMINPVGLSSFCLLGALSNYNDTPTTASRPFDHTRNGFVLGEGAAFLILENAEKAHARGARIYAYLSGEGNSLSSYRITDSHPNGDGAIQSIEGALREAELKPSAVDFINAHGTSTKMNDLSETNAIKHVFGEKALSTPVSATKSLTGHLIAAAGALEAGFTALSLYHQRIPMTANLRMPDPECNLDYVTEGSREIKATAAISNSFGFGGSNSCLAFESAEG